MRFWFLKSGQSGKLEKMSEQKQTMAQRFRELTKEMRRKWMGFLVGVLLAVGLGLIFSTTGTGTSLVFTSYDKLFYFRYSMQKLRQKTPTIYRWYFGTAMERRAFMNNF